MLGVFAKIANEEFDPDSTRSGRWKAPSGTPPDTGEPAGSSAKDGVDDPDPGDEISSFSSVASVDLHTEEEAETANEVDVPSLASSTRYVANSRTKALHVEGDAEGVAACGYIFRAASYESFEVPPSSGSWHLCRRPNCFKLS